MPLKMLLAATLVLAESAGGTSSTQLDDPVHAYVRDDFATEAKLARKGDPKAQDYLSAMYRDGRGTTKNLGLALVWLKKAAKAGSADAQNGLALRYKNGEGVTQSDRMAARWFERAAIQKYYSASIEIGDMYRDGRGVVRDVKRALYWYANVADGAGATLSRQRFGEICASYPCTSEDKIAAYKYISINSVRVLSSEKPAEIDLLGKLESGMTPEQIEFGRRLAQAWEAENPMPRIPL